MNRAVNLFLVTSWKQHDPSPSLREPAMSADLDARFVAFVEQRSGDLRRVAHHLCGNAEDAAELGMAVGTVKSTCHKALAKLRVAEPAPSGSLS